MSVHKDKRRGTWYVKFRNKTKRGFNTKQEAVKYEASLLTHQVKKPKEVVVKKTYKDIAELYLKECENNLQYGTYKRTKIFLDNFILPNIKNMPIDKYKKIDCVDFKNYIQSLDYSTRYKNEILLVYKAVFKYAYKYDFVDKNPSDILGKIKKTYEEKLKQIENSMNIWTIEEFSKFISYEDDEAIRALFVVLYYGGLRIGEALALKWTDYDGKSISVSKSLTRKSKNGSYCIKEPKSPSSVRKVPMSKSINRYLLVYKGDRQMLKDFSETWFMFGDDYPLAENTIKRHKDRNIQKAKVKRIRLHDFRHSHASNLIADGVNIVAVSKRLGHKDISVTLNTYTHLLEKNNEEMLEKLEKSSHNLLTDLLTDKKFKK